MAIKAYKYGYEPPHKVIPAPPVTWTGDRPRRQRTFSYALHNVYYWNPKHDTWVLITPAPITLEQARALVFRYRTAGVEAMRTPAGSTYPRSGSEMKL